MAELPPRAANTPLLALIAGRTCDAPKLFADVLAAGATHVYLEKPGATDADTLDELRADAERRGVGVVVGYNKNVAKYARLALAELRGRAAAGRPSPRVVLQHCNDFEEGEPLADFLRGPGGEGMLHNMCCHELALAVSRFGLSCARVAAVVLAPEKSAVVALDDAGYFDWQRVAFRLELRPPADGGDDDDDAAAAALASLSFEADRCAGNYSQLRLEVEGEATAAFRLPDLAQEKEIAAARAADAEMRPYSTSRAQTTRRSRAPSSTTSSPAAPARPPASSAPPTPSRCSASPICSSRRSSSAGATARRTASSLLREAAQMEERRASESLA